MYSPVKLWRNQEKIKKLVGKIGTIVTWTTVFVPPAGFADQAPYSVAIVKLVSGETVTCQLVDCNSTDIKAGGRVALVVRRITKPDESGIIPYGIKGKLIL